MPSDPREQWIEGGQEARPGVAGWVA